MKVCIKFDQESFKLSRDFIVDFIIILKEQESVNRYCYTQLLTSLISFANAMRLKLSPRFIPKLCFFFFPLPSLSCPPCSLDLTLLDLFLEGYFKDRIYREECNNTFRLYTSYVTWNWNNFRHFPLAIKQFLIKLRHIVEKNRLHACFSIINFRSPLVVFQVHSQ